MLYAFDLLTKIYEEAWEDPDSPPFSKTRQTLQQEYTNLEELRAAVPALILRHNLFGVDIDLRATQIAALALWLRAQKSYQALGLKIGESRRISRANVVCAEPMPGEPDLLREFTAQIQPRVLSQLVGVVVEKMKLAGEAGSLLRIEVEIRDAIVRARQQWLAATKREQMELFPETRRPKPEQLGIFDVSGITDEQFWMEAEGRIIEGLKAHAQQAGNGRSFQRRLFADDAAQGFGFIDLCRNRFEVILMNPPFGMATEMTKAYIERTYRAQRMDLAAAFISRCLEVLVPGGFLGALATRNIFFLSSYGEWRRQVTTDTGVVLLFADLGQGVLDTAMVQAAAVVFSTPRKVEAQIFFDQYIATDKGEGLINQIEFFVRGQLTAGVSAVDPASLGMIPNRPFSYWVSDRVRRIFSKFPSMMVAGLESCAGLQTNDDFRWVRLWWEVPTSSHTRLRKGPLPRSWVPFAKGGEHRRFYADLHLVVDWTNDGDLLKNWKLAELAAGQITANNSKCWNESKYFRSGVTWTQRSQIGLGVRALPSGSIFGIKGPAAFPASGMAAEVLLGIMNSSPFRGLVALQMSFGSYDSGVMQRTPIPLIATEEQEVIRQRVRTAVLASRQEDMLEETSHAFLDPFALRIPLNLEQGSKNIESFRNTLEAEASQAELEVDNLLSSLYGMAQKDLDDLTARIMKDRDETEITEEDDETDTGEGRSLVVGDIFACHLISYCVGVVFGRWDIRITHDRSLCAKLAPPFDPLPLCSPGMLVGPDGLPATSGRIVSEEWLHKRINANTPPPDGSVATSTIRDSQYPLRICWDSVLVDDPGPDANSPHQDDIVRRVREVLYLIWGDRAEATEKEACEIIGVKDLRDWLRNPRGFFDFHIKRYSKSRRKAPIYWLLQSGRRSFGLWLYYHRLNKDTLFKALQYYVEPKLRGEEVHLRELTTQFTAIKGALPRREQTRLEKTIEAQHELLNELTMFKEALQRVVALGFDPDLNDGVVLNIAPLHEMVPWREAKKYWDELTAGKYEWSTISQRLRAKGLVRG